MDYRIFPASCLWLCICTTILAQTEHQLKRIRAANNQEQLTQLIGQFEKEAQRTAIQLVQRGHRDPWPEKNSVLDGTVVALNTIGDDGTLLYYTTFSDPTSKVPRADALYTGGALDLDLTGKDMNVGVWDAGIALTTHREFNNRVAIGDDTGEVDSHTTMVTGTLVASGIKQRAKGIAFEANAQTHDWVRDKIEVAEAAANGLLLSNHSYGIKTDRVPDWYFGSYINVSRQWDDIMYHAPYYLMVTAAGNAQNSRDNDSPNFGKNHEGFDLLLGFATSKNCLVIAGASTQIDNNGQLKQAEVASYSSFGPLDDGRIKPDLGGDGTLIFTADSGTNNSYASSLGTSMATPGVTGSLLLLQQYHEMLYGTYMKAATLKGLALHTADDVQQPGPDYKMGWGIINTKAAAELQQRKGYSAQIEELSLRDGDTLRFEVTAKAEEPLKVSISWTDPAGEFVNRGDLNAPNKALMNDLDLRISKNGTTYHPWKLNPLQASQKALRGDNVVDPYERIDIADAQGTYTITVSHKGKLFNGAQDVSLIVSGIQLSTCELTQPEGLNLKARDTTSVSFDWQEADDTLFEVQFKKASQQIWTTRSTWENSFELDHLEEGAQYALRLRKVCSPQLASAFTETVKFTFQGADTQIHQTTDENSGSLGVVLFPNPVVNELQVVSEAGDNAQYSIVSSAGAIVQEGILTPTIEVSSLASGLYILKVVDATGSQRVKFYKN